MVIGNPRIIGARFLCLLKNRIDKQRTIIVGLKSDNYSREMLLRLLTLVVKPGDSVLAVHVQKPNGCFDPNTFHMHEDICKSKQVDFQVKVCVGDSYITELSRQVRMNFATILALGCNISWPKDSTVAKCVKALPPTCTLLVMDVAGRILVQKPGTSQLGSETRVLQSSLSSLPTYGSYDQPKSAPIIQKSLTLPSSSTPPPEKIKFKKPLKLSQMVITQKNFQRIASLELMGSCGRRFMFEELKAATDDFNPEFLIGEGGHSMVYRANLNDGQAAAVKVLKTRTLSEDDLFREIEILSDLRHENVIQLIGYCYSKDLHAVVYNLLKESLKQKLKQLRWNERMRIAIDVAKALDYLHSRSPPIVHRDVKSSNILLSENCQPKLSDFGAAMVHHQTQPASENVKPFHVVGTFGYLAPEYMMYGKVDEKTDVYSYGVVLLELITGKEALQTNQTSNHESLVLWARSLLSCGLCERLVDPCLEEDYDKDEMKMIMIAARLCLLHSSSRRPTMKTILQLFLEPEYWLKKQRKKEELLNRISSKGETAMYGIDDSDSSETSIIEKY